MSHVLTSSRFPSRRLLIAALVALACTPTLHAAEFREISWDELVPKGWDPSKSFKELSGLPDSDPRVQQTYDRMREILDNAPTVARMAGQAVKLPGYLVPLDESKDGLREFLLVPYFGACIHTPPPPANQIVHVRVQSPVKGLRSMDAVWVSGTLGVDRSDSAMGASGYTMVANSVMAYKGK